MTKKKYIHITMISVIIGFMLAVQYNTVQSPAQKETTDVWEIRQQLAEEKRLHSQLLSSLREANDTIQQYENAESTNPELILSSTVDEMRKQLGIESVEGAGFTIHIRPSEEAIAYGYEIKEISPSLLIRLVNDIYRYKGQYVEIDGQRLTYASAIRDINGQTTVNGSPISRTDCIINVISTSEKDATKLYNHLLSSSFMDEFYIDNFSLTIEEPKQQMTISGASVQVDTLHLQEQKGE